MCARLTALPAVPDAGALVDCFVDFGEVESAVADSIDAVDFGERRGNDELPLRGWTDAGEALAGAVCAALAGDADGTREALAVAISACSQIDAGVCPTAVSTKPLEGFAQYGLYPEQYAAAARHLCDMLSPRRLACIGIRSIGLPLAHVVSAAARRCGVQTVVRSVRPHGHPFDRQLPSRAVVDEQVSRF